MVLVLRYNALIAHTAAQLFGEKQKGRVLKRDPSSRATQLLTWLADGELSRNDALSLETQEIGYMPK